MSTVPSVKSLLAIPGMTESTARQCRRIMRKSFNQHEAEVALQACNDAFDQVPGIRAYGVEYLSHVDQGFREAPIIAYVNAGDTYSTTLLYRSDLDRFRVGSWGDEIESLERRGVMFA